MTTLIKEIEELIKLGKGKKPEEKLKYLDKVGKLRGELFKQYRKKKMPDNIKKLLSELGKVYPPTLYRLRKKR